MNAIDASIRAEKPNETGDSHDRTRGPRTPTRTPAEEGRRERLDRLGARVLRLLHLRDGGSADLSADLLSERRSDHRDRRVPRDLRRRLCRAADWRIRARPPRRHARSQDGAALVHVPDGLRDDRRRPAADLRSDRPAGAGPARDPAADSGLCGSRRNLRRKLDDPRTRAVRPARLLFELHAAGRAGRPGAGGGRVPAARALHAGRAVQQLGLAHSVPAERRGDLRGLGDPPQRDGDARLHRRGSTADARARPSSRHSGSTGPTCCVWSACR